MEVTRNNLPQISNELTKTQIKVIAKTCVDDLIEHGNSLNAAELISKLEFFIKEIRSNESFVESVREELSKHNHKFSSSSGTKIESAETGTKYDYSNCGDIEWNNANDKMIEFGELKKKREEFLKTIPISGLNIVDEQTGEMRQIFPPMKTSTSSFKVTIGN